MAFQNLPEQIAGTSDEANKIKFYSFSSNEEFDFYAFLTDFNDQFTSNWASTEVYGRMDPIYNFKNTVRKITLGFDVPSASPKEAELNIKKLDLLISSLYPVYNTITSSAEDTHGTALIGSPPLWRIRFGNLIVNTKQESLVNNIEYNARNTGLLGYIDGCAYKPDLESGWFIENPEFDNNKKRTKYGEMFPKLFKVNFTFNVIHEIPLGWKNDARNGKIRRSDTTLKFPHRYAGIRSETPSQPAPGTASRSDAHAAATAGSAATTPAATPTVQAGGRLTKP